uniref:Secapin-2 n=1 Tax=Harpegnathos saltator TaxID=610380 RepID=K7NBL5_HARSA|nr:secapin-2 [Harpegnathos saltator]
MKLSLAITYAIALLFFLLMSNAHSNVSQEKERFMRFDEKRKIELERSSIIHVPLNCPPNKVKVGDRCRSIF